MPIFKGEPCWFYLHQIHSCCLIGSCHSAERVKLDMWQPGAGSHGALRVPVLFKGRSWAYLYPQRGESEGDQEPRMLMWRHEPRLGEESGRGRKEREGSRQIHYSTLP